MSCLRIVPPCRLNQYAPHVEFRSIAWISYHRNGINGKVNGASKDTAGTFLGGFLVSLLLPIAGIAYYAFCHMRDENLGNELELHDEIERTMVEQIAEMGGQEL